MKPSFLIALVIAILLIGLFGVGLFANLPVGMLAYLCLSPFAFLALGRTSVGLMRRRAAFLTTEEANQLQRYRSGKELKRGL